MIYYSVSVCCGRRERDVLEFNEQRERAPLALAPLSVNLFLLPGTHVFFFISSKRLCDLTSRGVSRERRRTTMMCVCVCVCVSFGDRVGHRPLGAVDTFNLRRLSAEDSLRTPTNRSPEGFLYKLDAVL